MYTADRNQILHSGIHCSNLSAAHLYLFSTSFTYNLHNVQRRECFITFMGRSFWKRGHGGDICPCPMPSPVGMWCPSAPEAGGFCRGRLGTRSPGTRAPLGFFLGCVCWCGRWTEVQPGCQGSSHRPLLFRHAFLS